MWGDRDTALFILNLGTRYGQVVGFQVCFVYGMILLNEIYFS
jgi:hypothetical protein